LLNLKIAFIEIIILLYGSAYYWEVDNDAGNWVKPPTFHAKNLKLIAKFKPLILKDYSLENQGHPSYDQEATEGINIVTE